MSKKEVKEKLNKFFTRIENDISILDNINNYIILPNYTANNMLMCHKDYINTQTITYYGFMSKKQNEKCSTSTFLGVEIGTIRYDGCDEPKYEIVRKVE